MQQGERGLEGKSNGRKGSKNTNEEKRKGLRYLQRLAPHHQHTNTVLPHKGRGVSVSIGTPVRSMTLNIS